MKNRVVALAVAAASLGMAMPGMSPQVARAGLNPTPGPSLSGGMQAPQGGIGSLLSSLFLGPRPTWGGGGRKIRYGGNGHSVPQGKRMARKRRNRLRAKGQFRKAVR